MTSDEMSREICRVFSRPLKLDVDSGELFKFSYLQRAGEGSKSLCYPSVRSGRVEGLSLKAVAAFAEDDIPGLYAVSML